MAYRKLRFLLRGLMGCGATLLGACANVLLWLHLVPGLASGANPLFSLFLIAIFVGGGICGGLALRWAEEFFGSGE